MSIRWQNKIPASKALGYWPCKTMTIPAAVHWFRKELGLPPEIIVSKSSNVRTVQDVLMFASQAPTPIQQYLKQTYTPAVARAKYSELLRSLKHRKKISA